MAKKQAKVRHFSPKIAFEHSAFQQQKSVTVSRPGRKNTKKAIHDKSYKVLLCVIFHEKS
ncbi:MAG: hypothetical protein UDG94_10130 [Peptococcaceae bacterium]|nr:hypothetical protein [Peptococcaceae bacterium]